MSRDARYSAVTGICTAVFRCTGTYRGTISEYRTADGIPQHQMIEV